jgi:5-methylcytosine-specific restriction endonuclease McrA
MTTLCNNPEEQLTLTNGGHKDKMLVFVKAIDGRNLMPCTPSKARKLLRDGKAKAVKHTPFTIQLLFKCENQIQEVTVGVDKGAKVTGFACIGNRKLLISGEIYHRQGVKKKMEERRGCRRARRSRKWYRKPRFLNRASSRRSGRIPPSVRTNVEEVVRVVKKIPLPISHVEIEDVLIDIARLNDPTLEGKEYQKSNRLDENLRLACLLRDGFRCVNCKKKKSIKLHAHHIIWRSQGGKDTITNLTTLCVKCHDKVHDGKLDLGMKGTNKLRDVMAQRTMQGKTHMYSKLGKGYTVGKCFGYETAEYRKSLGLEKSHMIDALCIATLRTGEVIEYHKENQYQINFRAKQTRKRYFTQPKKGKGRVKCQVNKELCGFQKGDTIETRGFLKVVNSIYSNGMLAFTRIKGEPGTASPNNCKLIEKSSTIKWKQIV